MSDNPSPVDDPNDPADPPENPNPQSVSYETHRKLLNEKKRRDKELAEARERLEAHERAEREREEERLKEQKEFKEWGEKQKARADEAEQRLKDSDQRWANARKLNSFVAGLGVPLKEEYLGLVNLDEIGTDPTTGEIDDESVKAYVQKFRERFPEILSKPSPGGQPSDAPTPPTGAKLTARELARLPREERKKRMHELGSFKDLISR